MKTYFVSDLHLGTPNYQDSLTREKLFVTFLDEIKNETKQIFFLGDMFDYWYEYKYCVPRGFVRFLGKMAELTDNGIEIHFFTGNHDIWIFDYLPQETGIILHREPLCTEISGKKFYLAHGDGLGPYDKSFKIMKKFFTNRVAQWFYSKIHPNISMGFAHRWSQERRKKKNKSPKLQFLGEEEWLIIYSRKILTQQHFDYFVFGHRHVPSFYKLSEKSFYINVGDWLKHFTFAVFDGEEMELKKYSH